MGSFSKKKILIILIIILGIIGVSFGIYKVFVEKTEKEQIINKDEDIIKEEIEETTTVILSINPKLALVIDKNGNILSIYPLNEDANIFINKDFEGLKLEEAVEKVVEVAEVYFEEKAEISLFVSDGEEKQIEQVESLFNSKGIKTHKLDLDELEKKEINEKIKQEKEKRDKEEKTTKKADKTTTKKTTTKKIKKTTKKNTTTTKVPETITKIATTTKVPETITKIATTTKVPETTTINKSNNNYLKSLSVENISINFSKNINNYDGIVSYSTTNINIKAIAEDDKSNVIGTGSLVLEVGENNFTVKVIAEDGNSREYNIKVIRRPMINLNNNKTYHYSYITVNDEYVYPTTEECIGKMPHEVSIPEGLSYNEYCKNNPPTNYPNIDGLGYYCILKNASNNSDDMSVNKVYECHFINELVYIDDVRKKADQIIKVNNYVGFAGGYGIEPESIKLDEDKCDKFNISCGRW